MEKKPSVTVKQDDDDEISAEILATAIRDISEGFKKMRRAGLTDRALVVLLHDLIGPTYINKGQITQVLKHLPKLSEIYLKKP